MLKIKVIASKSEKEHVYVVENVYILLRKEEEGREGKRVEVERPY